MNHTNNGKHLKNKNMKNSIKKIGIKVELTNKEIFGIVGFSLLTIGLIILNILTYFNHLN